MSFLSSRFVFLVLGLVSCAICVAIPLRASPALYFENDQKRHNDGCGFAGNSDLYGLGIRLGVYFQWASTLIIYGWYPEGRNDLVESYLGFLVAITIAIIVITAQTEPTYAAEIFVLAYLIFGGIYTVMTIGARQHHRVRSGFLHVFQLFVLCIISASAGIYYSWFWIHGIHHNVLETPCGTFGFLFTKVSLYNPSVYKFLAFLSVSIGGGNGFNSVTLLVLFWLFFLRNPTIVKYAEQFFTIRTPPSDETSAWTSGDSKTEKFINSWSSEGISLFSLAYSIIGIEMTLYWNSIRDVYTINTTGQLIPFVIGLVGLGKVTYEPIKIVSYHTLHTLSLTDSNIVVNKHLPRSIDDASITRDDVDGLIEQVGQEVVEANHRLGYLDLSTPVDEMTVRKVNKNRELRRRRTTRISQTSRPTSPSPLP